MHYSKGGSGQDSCGNSSACGEKGWTWHESPSSCHKSPVSSPCHNPGSLSHDTEGSCQSVPQGCQPTKACTPPSCCPSQQNKPRRRVEVSHAQPVCPPPVKIRRRPLQQFRPPLHGEGPGCCDKPCRRVEQETCPPMIPLPQPLQHRCPCAPCCRPPVQHRCSPPIQHCCPAPRALPLHPSQHQQKQVPLLPPCLQMK